MKPTQLYRQHYLFLEEHVTTEECCLQYVADCVAIVHAKYACSDGGKENSSSTGRNIQQKLAYTQNRITENFMLKKSHSNYANLIMTFSHF